MVFIITGINYTHSKVVSLPNTVYIFTSNSVPVKA